jgi:hypothetical protein
MRLLKTELGQTAFKERSPLFSVRQRAMFILFDGKKSAADILSATAGMGATAEDVDALLAQGFLAQVAEPPPSAAPVPAPAVKASEPGAGTDTIDGTQYADNRTEQQIYQDAKPLATKLTAGLGLRGFRLNLAVESAAGVPELLALLPKIQEAVGTKACRELERALKG